jgi:hypothetical protein
VLLKEIHHRVRTTCGDFESPESAGHSKSRIKRRHRCSGQPEPCQALSSCTASVSSSDLARIGSPVTCRT